MLSWPKRLALLGAGALGVRLAVLSATSGYRPLHDDASYLRVARWLLIVGHYPVHRVPHGGFQVSAYRPPGWPALMAAVLHFAGPDNLVSLRVLAAVLGAMTVMLVAIIARQLFGDKAAIVAGVLAALSPLALLLNATLESEALFTTLALASASAALAARRSGHWRWVLAAGVCGGLAALTRTNGLVLLAPVAILASSPLFAIRTRLLRGAVVVLVGLLVVSPWTIRNARALHTFVPVSTETGNTLAGTYNDISLHNGARWIDPRHFGLDRAIFQRYGASAQGDVALRGAVMHWVARHPTYPLRVVTNDSARLLGLAGPDWAAFSMRTISLSGSTGALVWASTLLGSVLAAVGLALSRGRGVWAYVLFAAALLLPAAFVNGEMRLGAPAQAALLPFAGLALVRLLETARQRSIAVSNA